MRREETMPRRRASARWSDVLRIGARGAALKVTTPAAMLRRLKSEALDLPGKVRTWMPLEVPTGRVGGAERRALDYLGANPARSGPTWMTFLGLLNKARKEEDPKAAPIPDWSPNQLRHAAATEIRKKFGLEAAQVVLGHSTADITQVYAERNQALAAQVIRQIG
jgi:integrase